MDPESIASEDRADESFRPRPRVSFGLPVRNAESLIRQCLDSLLGQDFADLEVVVCDNDSTDGTRGVLEEYAARDCRVRFFRNPKNIGQIENVNRVFHLSEGEYFRWIGADDWLEPHYASRCVKAMDDHPEAVAVTTYFQIHAEEGDSAYEEYRGEWVSSLDPARRFARMLWFFHAGDRKYDPVYSMIRRDVLGRTQLIRMMDRADQMLAAELSLLGPFAHVPQCLAHRRKSYRHLRNKPMLMRRYDETHHAKLPSSALETSSGLVRNHSRTQTSRREGKPAAYGLPTVFSIRDAYRRWRSRFRLFLTHQLGLSRRNLRFWTRSTRGQRSQ